MVVCGEVRILPAFQESQVAIFECNLNKDLVIEDQDSVTATAVVQNRNPVPAIGTVEFLVGGATTEVEVEIPPNDGRVEISEDFIFQEPGTETVEIETVSFQRNDQAAAGR